jgi:S-methylmethionine-dependent homocysteine/selenocysteine methylase
MIFMQTTFRSLLKESSFILTEGAIVERLKSEFGLNLDEHINHAGLVYDAKKDLSKIYRQYIDIAQRYNHPIMLLTPTRKVTAETLEKSVYHESNVIADCCLFLQKIKSTYQGYSENIFVGGLLGCKGDAYCADEALSSDEAYSFHKVQVTHFRNQHLDYLFAAIMPAVSEAVGMAKAMAESELPYIISFMVRKDGRLLDGTFISEAIRIIDESVSPQPVCYMANCIHPSNLKQALRKHANKNCSTIKRFMGIQANSSSLSPEELDQSNTLHQDDPDELIQEMCNLQKEFGLKIMGGCCGTDDHFINKLAQTYPCKSKEMTLKKRGNR